MVTASEVDFCCRQGTEIQLNLRQTAVSRCEFNLNTAGEYFIESCHHEIFKAKREQKLHEFLCCVQETE
jgi:hypothetical protein